MNGPEHFREAERLIGLSKPAADQVAAAAKAGDARSVELGTAITAAIFAAAQVHATLALAAAMSEQHGHKWQVVTR